MTLNTLFSKLIEREWGIAYRKNNRNNEILDSHEHNFILIKNTLRYWCADPFVVEDGGKTYIFFEAYDRIKRKGVIAYREVDGGRIGKIKVIIEESFHMSYPYIYNENDAWFIIPETNKANRIIRYKSVFFPDIWIKEKVLVDNISTVDTTLFYNNNEDIKLFTYRVERFNKGLLEIFHLNKDTQTSICTIDDIKGVKRPAGKIYIHNNELFRPSQLCTRSYGEAIIFNKVLKLAGKSFDEIESKIVTFKDIKLDKKIKIMGVHTYNQSVKWEVIDVEFRSVFGIISIIPRVYELIKRSIKNM